MGTGLRQGLVFLPSHACHPIKGTFEVVLSGSSLQGKRSGAGERATGQNSAALWRGEQQRSVLEVDFS